MGEKGIDNPRIKTSLDNASSMETGHAWSVPFSNKQKSRRSAIFTWSKVSVRSKRRPDVRLCMTLKKRYVSFTSNSDLSSARLCCPTAQPTLLDTSASAPTNLVRSLSSRSHSSTSDLPSSRLHLVKTVRHSSIITNLTPICGKRPSAGFALDSSS